MVQTAAENAFELAARRLERALVDLEHRLAQAKPAKAAGADLFDAGAGATQLNAELAQARAREQELEAAGAEASAALGRAIQEIRAALSGAQAAEA